PCRASASAAGYYDSDVVGGGLAGDPLFDRFVNRFDDFGGAVVAEPGGELRQTVLKFLTRRGGGLGYAVAIEDQKVAGLHAALAALVGHGGQDSEHGPAAFEPF